MVVRDRAHTRVMAFERADAPGHWQLPQGGLDAGEDPVDGAWRELSEETGLGPDDVAVLAEFPEWVAYEWTADIIAESGRDGRRRGQVQKWFLFDVLSDAVNPTPDGSEFVAWRWVEPAWLIDHVPEFRRAAYAKVLGTL
ncbi:MAG: hypothetical protein RLZZ623_2301 [Actinomycetota bacterium]